MTNNHIGVNKEGDDVCYQYHDDNAWFGPVLVVNQEIQFEFI